MERGRYYNEDDRLLQVERELVVHRRRFRLALAGYIILAIGVAAALFIQGRLISDNREDDERTMKAAGVFCELLLTPDADRQEALERAASGHRVVLTQEPCKRIARDGD